MKHRALFIPLFALASLLAARGEDSGAGAAPAGGGEAAVLRKLRTIVVPSLAFDREGESLADQVAKLNELAAEWDLDESDPAKKGVRIALELNGYPCGPHEDPDSPGATIRMVACPLESVLEAFSETLELDCSVSGDGVALFHRDDPRHAGWSFALYAGLDALMSPQDEPVESVSDDDSWSKEVFPAFTGSSDPFSDSSDFDGSLKSFLGDCARMGWPSGSFLWTLPGRRAFAVFDASRHLDKLENRIGPSGAFPRLRPLFRLDAKPEHPGRLSGGAAADAGAEEDSPEQRLKVAWSFGIAVDEKRRTEADLRCEFLRRAESAGWKLRDGAIERAAESARRARTERTNGDLDYFALKAIVAAWPETNRTEFARSVPEWRNEEWLCFARAAEDWKWLVFLLDSDVSPERKWLPFCTDGFPGSGLVRAVLAESVLEADTNQFSHLELDFGFLSGEADETAEDDAWAPSLLRDVFEEAGRLWETSFVDYYVAVTNIHARAPGPEVARFLLRQLADLPVSTQLNRFGNAERTRMILALEAVEWFGGESPAELAGLLADVLRRIGSGIVPDYVPKTETRNSLYGSPDPAMQHAHREKLRKNRENNAAQESLRTAAERVGRAFREAAWDAANDLPESERRPFLECLADRAALDADGRQRFLPFDRPTPPRK